jgi:ureidoglycolate lyase
MPDTLPIQPLTSAGFAPFGDVVEFEGHDSFPINKGMADRYHALADVELGGEQARAIISLVDSRKFDMPRKVDHLEHHPLGSQAFLPLDASPFINYRLGTWHHVLLTPYAAMRFICVDRTGPGDNCTDFFIPDPDQRLLELA